MEKAGFVPDAGTGDVRFRVRSVFRAKPERVWDVLTDWPRQASWMPDVSWMRPSGAAAGLGARLEVRTKVFAVPFVTDVIEVTGWEPPRRLAIEHRGVVSGVGEWRLDPLSGGTRFSWTEDLEMPPPVLGELALLAYGPWQRWMLKRSVENLGRLVESRARVPISPT